MVVTAVPVPEAVPQAERPAAARLVRMVVTQVGYEQRAFWRNPASAFFTFALPVILLVVFAGVFGNQKVSGTHLHGAQYYLGTIIVYGMIASCFSALVITTTTRRDTGILKRVRGTPMPGWAYVATVVANAMVVALAVAVVSVAFATLAYGVAFPHNVGQLLLVVLVGGFSWCALGLAVSGLMPNVEAAQPLANIVMLVLLFISGTYFHVSGGLAKVADWFPVIHLNHLSEAAVVGPPFEVWNWHDLVVVAVWGAAGIFACVRRFRWEPRAT